MSVPLSDTRLTEIRERKAAATGGGRWILLAGRTVDEYRVKAVIGEDEVAVGTLDFGAGPAARDDKTFVVNAGCDLTALLAEVDRLRKENRNLGRSIDEVMRERDYAESMADKLAAAIAPEDVLGEHSDGNFPWQNALDWAAEKERTFEVQQAENGQLRARLAEVAELHAPMGGDCGYCADETAGAHRWPCPTATLADAATPTSKEQQR